MCSEIIRINIMKQLKTREWIAVVVSVGVIGFFFVFGQTVLSFFTQNNSIRMQDAQNTLGIDDVVIGTGLSAEAGNRVTVHYTGRFADGTVFDSSVTRGEPFQFVLGGGQVIEGWDKGIVGMKVGGKRTLTIPPTMGYGPKDYGPIPGNSTLIFDVELLRVDK